MAEKIIIHKPTKSEFKRMAAQMGYAPVVHGRWISTNIGLGRYKCSVCEMEDEDCSDYYSSHNVLDQEYCPSCGAKMDGGADNATD